VLIFCCILVLLFHIPQHFTRSIVLFADICHLLLSNVDIFPTRKQRKVNRSRTRESGRFGKRGPKLNKLKLTFEEIQKYNLAMGFSNNVLVQGRGAQVLGTCQINVSVS
jgi:hypothetical protein